VPDERWSGNSPRPDESSLNAVGGHCPVCGQEYRPGFTVCSDDGAELVPGPGPVDPVERERGVVWEPPGAEGLRAIGRTEDPPVDLGADPMVLGSWRLQEALLIAGLLRSSGIPALAEHDQEFGPFLVLDVMRPRLVKVFVRADDLERAGQLVREASDGTA
jgi:hypothetical protein